MSLDIISGQTAIVQSFQALLLQHLSLGNSGDKHALDGEYINALSTILARHVELLQQLQHCQVSAPQPTSSIHGCFMPDED